MGFAVLHQGPRRRGEELQLSGALQLIVLLRGRRLRESNLLPNREGIAVMRVNAEMFDMREVHGLLGSALPVSDIGFIPDFPLSNALDSVIVIGAERPKPMSSVFTRSAD